MMGSPGDGGAVLRFGRTDLQRDSEVAGQRPGGVRPADAADQISGLVHPHLIDLRFELPPAYIADGVLLATGPVRRQQFLQQIAGQLGLGHHHDLPRAIVRHSTTAGLTER
jgi:hypothetical protein